MDNSYTDKKDPEIFEYLNGLRESGVCNMFGAGPYVEAAFDYSKDDARDVVTRWMKQFGKPNA